MQLILVLMLAAAAGSLAAGAEDPWLSFADETQDRLIASQDRGVFDMAETAFAVGDVDNDGDQDVVVARKEEYGVPCEGSPACRNQLLMNEGIAEGHTINGVLVDRTMLYVTLADDGGQGFWDVTNDRDVQLVDVNGDGWLDIVTAAAVSDGLSKTISHPRIYVNEGELGGEWQGFRYEESRIPQLHPIGSAELVAPRFSSIAVGDVDNDGDVDLYFSSNDNGASNPPMPAGHDLNDRLLINDGTGYFADSLETRMSGTILESAYAASAIMVDVNGDSALDIIKTTGLLNPWGVTVSYNDPNNIGYFSGYQFVFAYEGNSGTDPNFVRAADFNLDGRLDLYLTVDEQDQVLLNQGNDPDGFVLFDQYSMTGDNIWAGDTVIADLDKDGYEDVIVTGKHDDFPCCELRMFYHRNMGDGVGNTLEEDVEGAAPWAAEGAHDVAVLDIDGDDSPDLLIGTEDGNQIWISELIIPQASVAGPRYVSMDVADVPGEFAIAVSGDEQDSAVSCVGGYLQADGTLQPGAVFMNAAQWGENVDISGSDFLPGAAYTLYLDTGATGAPDLGPPATVTLSKWGDVDGNGFANFSDLLLITLAFQGDFQNVTLEQADLGPCAPNGFANFEDLLLGVQAFQGFDYAATGCPIPCD